MVECDLWLEARILFSQNVRRKSVFNDAALSSWSFISTIESGKMMAFWLIIVPATCAACAFN